MSSFYCTKKIITNFFILQDENNGISVGQIASLAYKQIKIGYEHTRFLIALRSQSNRDLKGLHEIKL